MRKCDWLNVLGTSGTTRTFFDQFVWERMFGATKDAPALIDATCLQ